MIGSLVTMMVLSAGGSADALTAYKVKSVSLMVPAAWQKSVEDGSHKFMAPSGDAYFVVDVGAVQSKGMDGQACVNKILANLGGGQSWERVNVGSAPAAKLVVTDVAPDNKGEVETVSYVGCDGRTTWSVIFHIDKKKRERFAPLATQVAESVKYARTGGK
jgi:hypothetical protein